MKPSLRCVVMVLAITLCAGGAMAQAPAAPAAPGAAPAVPLVVKFHNLPIVVEDAKLIKPEQLKPNGSFEVPLPILGKSTHRTRRHASTVMMAVHLPEDYQPGKAFPVVIHMGGGVDQRKFIGRWQRITGNKGYIIMEAEFTSSLITGPRNAAQMLRVLEAATPIQHGGVVLAGISSASWGMNSNFENMFYDRGYLDAFDAFIFIAGNNNKNVSVTKDKLRGRPALFVGGNTGGAHRIQKATHDAITKDGGDSTWIDMMHSYDDFPGTVDAPMMEWIRKKLAVTTAAAEAFDKKLAAAKTGSDYLALLKDPSWYYAGRTKAVTAYVELAKKASASEQKAMVEKLAAVPIEQLPRCTGGEYQEALKWVKANGGEPLVKKLAPQNPFLDPVPGFFNGYAPGTNFNTR